MAAEFGGKMQQREGGHLAKVKWELGGTSLAPHIDAQRVTKFFGEQHDVDQFVLLARIVSVVVPVDIGPGGNRRRELAYRNHISDNKHASEVWKNAVGDVKTGRAIVFPARLARMVRGLRINPVGVVEERGTRFF